MKYLVAIGGREIEVVINGDRITIDGRAVSASLVAVPDTPVRQLLLEGSSQSLPIIPAGRGHWELLDHGDHWEVEVLDERTHHIRSLTAGSAAQAGAAPLKAPMPGLVVRVLARPGEEVAAGAGLIVLEAMKMENELKALAAARVRAIPVEPGQPVEKGQVLVEFEALPPA